MTVITSIFLITHNTLNHSDDNTSILEKNNTSEFTQNVNYLVLTGCTTDSNGAGKIDITCPNYDVLHFTRDPPIKESIWTGVQLTIDHGNYTMQYTTPTGTNQYALIPYSTSDIQRILSSPTSSTIEKISRLLESENQAIGGIFHQTKQDKFTNPLTREELYQYALQVINQDRINHGVSPVALSNVSSAQNHADDMLNTGYFSHWNTVGVKPYVTYTKLGGRGDVNENISVTTAYCPSSNCKTNYFDPVKQINDSEYDMMYKDQGSDWGHRDNIINPEFTDVNIGIAYNNEKFYFVEHFENNRVKWQTMELEDSNKLHLVGTLPPGYSLYQIELYTDPNSEPLTSTTLDTLSPYNLGYYDQGNFAGVMLPRPEADSHYPECSKGKAILDTTKGEVCVVYVTYTNISTVPLGIDISPDISNWIGSGLLHTFYVTLKKQDGKQVYVSSVTLEYLK